MRWRALYPWFLGEMAAFVVLHLGFLSLIWRFGHAPIPSQPLQLALLAFAVYRGTHILSNEKITKPIRSPFITTHMNSEGREVETPLETGPRGAIGALICCPACTGIWVATVLVYGYMLLPLPGTVIILVLALSGVERFLTMVFDFLKTRVNLATPRD
jgi:hypothetical protein